MKKLAILFIAAIFAANIASAVDLSELGQDLMPGKWWTPEPDFSSGTKYYFDPSASVSGDGTLASPFRSLGWEVEQNVVIKKHTSLNQDPPSNDSVDAVVGANDVCILMPGNHGEIEFLSYYFDGYLGIVGQDGATFDYLGMERIQGFYVENLEANVRERHTWPTPGTGFDGAPEYIRATRDSNGNGVASYIVIKDCVFSSGTTTVADSWSDAAWDSNTVDGIYTSRADHVQIQGNSFSVMNYGMKNGGSSADPNEYLNIVGNTGEYFNGDGIQVGTSEYTYVSQNTLQDFYLTNSNHMDMIQFHSGNEWATVERNLLIGSTDPDRWTSTDFQGILFSTADVSSDVLITGNVIITGDTWDGIKINGGTNCSIVNNTVIGQDRNGDANPPHIKFLRAGTNCLVANNIAGVCDDDALTGVTVTNNFDAIRDFEQFDFVDFTQDGDPLDFDLSLASDSKAIGVGHFIATPMDDFDGLIRPQHSNYDIGAYEFEYTFAEYSCDVDISVIGDDLVEPEYWSAEVDFEGDKYYFDPRKLTKGDGTLSNPFRGFGIEVASDSTLERRNASQTLLNSANGPVVEAGDVCVLLGGNHGDIDFSSYYYDDWLGIVGMPGQDVWFNKFDTYLTEYLYIEGLTSSHTLRSGFETPGAGVANAPSYMRLVGHSSTDANNLIIKDCVFSPTPSSAAWDSVGWTANAPNGLFVQYFDNFIIQDNTFDGVNFGIQALDCDVGEIYGNSVSNISADGIQCGENGNRNSSNIAIKRNVLIDFFDVSANHNDAIQFYGDTDSVLIDSNFIMQTTDLSRGLIGQLAGIMGSNNAPDQMEDARYFNNVVMCDAYNGVVINNGVDCLVANNTLAPLQDTLNDPGIVFVNSMSNCKAINNVAKKVVYPDSNYVASNNYWYGSDPANAGFESWTRSGNPLLQDLHPSSTSTLLDSGTATSAPTIDYDEIDRPQNGTHDIGAYEYIAPPVSRVSSGIVALYNFGEESGTVVNDVSGVGSTLDLTISNSSAVSWVSGGGLELNSSVVLKPAGSSTKIYTACDATDELTIEAWVTPANVTQDGPARIVTYARDGTSYGGNFMLGQDEAGAEVRLRSSVPSETDKYGNPALTEASVFSAATLVHLVFTRADDDTTVLYVDGASVETGTTGGDFGDWEDTLYHLALGNDPVDDRPWLGTMHLVAIYDKALSFGEVLQNYNAGESLSVAPAMPAITTHPADTSVGQGSTATFEVASTGTHPFTYQWQRDGVDISGATSASYTTGSLTIAADDGAEFRCEVSNAAGCVASNSATLTVVEPDPRVTNGLIALYDFASSDTTTVFDVSGYKTALDLDISSSASITRVSGGNGLTIDSAVFITPSGSSGKIYAACDSTDEVTVEAWVSPANVTQNGPARIVTYARDGETYGGNFMLGQDGAGLEARLRTNVPSETDKYGSPALTESSVFAATTLVHLVFTRAADDTTRLYVDGVLKETGTTGGDFGDWEDTNYEFALVNDPVTARPWLGTMYLAAVYNRELSAAEVLQNFYNDPTASGSSGESITDGTGDELLSPKASPLPKQFALHQNHPNPFNPFTTIRFDLPQSARVRLSIYDIAGRLVKQLKHGEMVNAGRLEVVWRGDDQSGRAVAAGVYFYKLDAGKNSATRRMTLVK